MLYIRSSGIIHLITELVLGEQKGDEELTILIQTQVFL